MKILIINTNNSAGGATKACVRLHHSLIEQGVDSKLLMLEQPDKNIVKGYSFYEYYLQQQTKNKSFYQKVYQKFLYILGLSKEAILNKERKIQEQILKQRKQSLEVFTFSLSLYEIQSHPLYKEADIIHLHWVAANFLDYENFFLNNTKPIVWTLHDMNPFTGGCHYSESCEKFIDTCSNCPQLEGTIDSNYGAKMLHKKYLSLSSNPKQNITIISPSKWLLDESKKSKLFKNLDHFQIPYGIDSSVFRPHNKEQARSFLNLPQDKIIILFIAYVVDNKRKGYTILKEAIHQIEDKKNIAICTVGAKNTLKTTDANFHELGSFSDEIMMSIIYSAADVFVIPTLEDNLPNTVIESLLCGTPVIGFPVGGIVDMIQHNQNGYVCEVPNAYSLQQTIELFIKNPKKFDTNQIRENAVLMYDSKVQKDRYLELYHKLIKII